MSTPVDLRALAVDRPSREAAEVRRPRNLVARYVVPAAIVLGFASVLAWSLRDWFMPASPVTVVPVIVTRSDIQAVDTPLFQAAGWVEPRPTPVQVSALVEGVVERLTVIEGQAVEAGEPLAYLIDKDARLALRQAEADLALQMAELSAAEAELVAARKLLDDPIPRLAELADAEAQLTKVQTDLARLPAQVDAAEARRALAQREVETKTAAKDSLPGNMVRRAESELKVVVAQLDEYRLHASALAKELKALSTRRDVLQRQVELKIDEHRAVAAGQAQVAAAQARVEQAAAAREVAILRLERHVVTAPIAGKILALTSRPGSKLMGQAPAGMADASTVVTMYDPASLQVRADVRLEDLPQVLVGQTVQVETSAVKGPLTGKVITATSLADIQKNTLQIKVSIDNPPPVLKPDMLVQVTFLAPPRPDSVAQAAEPVLRVAAPVALIDGAGDQAATWVADLAVGVARQRKLKLGRPLSRELVEVTSGLAIGDRLIVAGRESLTDGQRIRVVREDAALGKENHSHSGH